MGELFLLIYYPQQHLNMYVTKCYLASINPKVTEESRRAQFLIPVDADGQNQAQASLDRAQLLNPMVEVKADTDAVGSKPDDFFFQFDAVSAGTSSFTG